MSSLRRNNPSGDWNAIQHDHDELMLQADTQQYFALTKQHQWLLLALCEYATWGTRWYSQTGNAIDYDDLDLRVSDMIYRLMSPVSEIEMFKLRQNPENTCLLEQSADNGESWQTAFDYNLCHSISQLDISIYLQLVIDANTKRLGDYDDTPQSINEDCPPVFDSGALDVALCAAVGAYVDGQVLASLTKYRIAAGLAAGGTGLLAWGLGPLGLVLGGAVLVITAINLSDLEAAAHDRSSLDGVACDLVAELEGVTVTEANFITAIEGLTGTGYNEQTIVSVLQGNRNEQVNYLWFVDLLGEAQGLPASTPCTCGCVEALSAYYVVDPVTEGLTKTNGGTIYPSHAQSFGNGGIHIDLGASAQIFGLDVEVGRFSSDTTDPQWIIECGAETVFTGLTLSLPQNGQMYIKRILFGRKITASTFSLLVDLGLIRKARAIYCE
jgi:hypothetical protein